MGDAQHTSHQFQQIQRPVKVCLTLGPDFQTISTANALHAIDIGAQSIHEYTVLSVESNVATGCCSKYAVERAMAVRCKP